MNTLKTSFLLLTAVFVCNGSTSAQTETWTKEKAAKWFEGREWANGLQLKAHESVNQQEFAKQYTKNKAYWDKAFAWLKNTKLETVAPGKYYIDTTNVFVTVTDGATTKAFQDTKWEAHRKYADIQYIVRGKEKMGIAPVAKATSVDQPYNETKDAGNYSFSDSDSKYYIDEPGTFLIFFPSDSHRPNIKVDGFDTVRKVVVKVKVD
jgi:YhcH/YjgK/YiaL family protein